jgi:prophage antirepressor-like protein
MGDITTYQFNTHNIRVVTVEGEPWFLAADVCRVLEMPLEKGVSKYLAYLDESEKRSVTPGQIGGKGMSHAKLISESGLYKRVLRSDKPQAKPFQDWVTKEVLPAIRKDGAYIAGEEKLRTGEMSEDGTEA